MRTLTQLPYARPQAVFFFIFMSVLILWLRLVFFFFPEECRGLGMCSQLFSKGILGHGRVRIQRQTSLFLPLSSITDNTPPASPPPPITTNTATMTFIHPLFLLSSCESFSLVFWTEDWNNFFFPWHEACKSWQLTSTLITQREALYSVPVLIDPYCPLTHTYS